MNRLKKGILLVPVCLLVAACTTIPDGPSVMVLPGTGKSFDAFQADDLVCKQFASNNIGKDPNQYSLESGAKTAALGTALGAVAGAVIDGGSGALVGAGTGLAVGGLAGASSSGSSGYSAQRRYDNAYQQCMFARGNRIPGAGSFTETTTTRAVQPYPQQQTLPPNTTTPPPAQYIIQP